MRSSKHWWLVVGIVALLLATACTPALRAQFRSGNASETLEAVEQRRAERSESHAGPSSDEHPWIGIRIATLIPRLATRLGLPPETNGILVAEVVPESPGAVAGLEREDVLTAIDGETLTSTRQLVEAVRSSEVGETVSLTLLRDGEGHQVSVELGEAPQHTEHAAPRDFSFPFDQPERLRTPGRLGVLVAPITPELAERLDVDPHLEGIVILHVFPRTPAEEAGLKRGYVIQAIDGQGITSVRQLQAAVEEAGPGDAVTLTINDGEDISTVEVTLGEIESGVRDLLRRRFFRHRSDDLKTLLPRDLLEGSAGRVVEGEVTLKAPDGDLTTVKFSTGTVESVNDDFITIVLDVDGESVVEVPTDTPIRRLLGQIGSEELERGQRVFLVEVDDERRLLVLPEGAGGALLPLLLPRLLELHER